MGRWREAGGGEEVYKSYTTHCSSFGSKRKCCLDIGSASYHLEFIHNLNIRYSCTLCNIIVYFFHVNMTSSKHQGGWEHLRQLRKPEIQSIQFA